MSALPARTRGAILQAHQSLKMRMVAALPPPITPLNVYEAMVSERHREILREAKELGARSSSYHTNVTFPYNAQQIIVDMEDCGLVPVALTARHQKLDLEWPFVEALCQWADQIIEIYHKFQRGEHILDLLEERCASIKQMRYFLPAIATLVTVGGNRELGQELSASPVVRNAPTLPFGARQAIADYNALIAQASLLPSNKVRDNINVKYVTFAAKPWSDVQPTNVDE